MGLGKDNLQRPYGSKTVVPAIYLLLARRGRRDGHLSARGRAGEPYGFIALIAIIGGTAGPAPALFSECGSQNRLRKPQKCPWTTNTAASATPRSMNKCSWSPVWKSLGLLRRNEHARPSTWRIQGRLHGQVYGR